MFLPEEIKQFIRKLVLLSLLFSVLINLTILYLGGAKSDTDSQTQVIASNDTTFTRRDITYLGDIGVAISLNVGLSKKAELNTPASLYSEALPIATILADASVGQTKILSSNMVFLQGYLNVLKTDLNSALDTATDRKSYLDTFTDELKYRYVSGQKQAKVLTSQMSELNRTVASSVAEIETIKTELSKAYKNFDYDTTEDLFAKYLEAKKKSTYAQAYLVFLEKFGATLQILNNYNKVYLDTILNNQEALVKKATVVLPDSGNALLKKLDLVKTEAEWKKISAIQ